MKLRITAGHGEQHQHGEHRSEIEAEIGLQDQHADASLGADKLADMALMTASTMPVLSPA